jgi:hypothetical protein
MLAGHERTDHGLGVEARAELQGIGRAGELVGELVDPVAIHEEPGVSGADLPGVEQAALQAADDGRVDVGVAGDDARRLAAEFEAEPFQVAVRRGVHDRTADLGRASERHLV